MKNFFKLLSFELNRFYKLYVIMLIVIFVVQLGAVLLSAIEYMTLVKDITKGGRVTPEQFLYEYWPYSLADSVYSLGFLAPIAIGIAGLLFYMFFIWYRDWFARNTFIYRLLMLPTNRMNIFYAKLTAIFLTVLGAISIQLIYLAIYQQVVKWIVPVVYRMDVPTEIIIRNVEHLNFIIPDSISVFFISYAIGLAFVIVIFTAILFERSYQLIGLIIGILYVAVSFLIFILPFVIQFFFFNTFYLYIDEMFYLQGVIVVAITAVSLWISHHLMNKKITV